MKKSDDWYRRRNAGSNPLHGLALPRYICSMTRREPNQHVDFDNPDYSRYGWYLDCFDKMTEAVVWTRRLPITTDDARRVLKWGPGRSIVGGFSLTKAAADRLNDTLDEKIAFDFINLDYVIELCDTQSGAATG